MGQASSHALGLALGRPDKQVIVLDGDGSLLMNLGTLVTIANIAPTNFIHFVCENGTYKANGAHPIPGQGKLDFAGLARAAGYAHAQRIDTLAQIQTEIAAILQMKGAVFVALNVESGESYPQDYIALHSTERRAQFKAALNSG